MRKLLILICCAGICRAAPRSIQDVDWKNFSYPLPGFAGVPEHVSWMGHARESSSPINGRYVVPDSCSDDKRVCTLVTLNDVRYGTLNGINSIAAAVVLTWHSGGTANWQFVYVFTLQSAKPRLLAWLRTGSRADRGLREAAIAGGNLVLTVNNPDKRERLIAVRPGL